MTNKGKYAMYHESNVSLIGTKGAGIRAIALKEDDEVVASLVTLRRGNKAQLLAITNKGGLKVINPTNLIELTARTNKPNDLYKFYNVDAHYLVSSFLAHDDAKYFVLSNIRAAEILDIDTSKTTPLGKSIKSSLLINEKEEIRIIKTYDIASIGTSTKIYKSSDKEEEKIIESPVKEKKVEEKKDEKPEQLSFLNYINDL
jgi:DNA gyrase/topoisomerase IV subunit A